MRFANQRFKYCLSLYMKFGLFYYWFVFISKIPLMYIFVADCWTVCVRTVWYQRGSIPRECTRWLHQIQVSITNPTSKSRQANSCWSQGKKTGDHWLRISLWSLVTWSNDMWSCRLCWVTRGELKTCTRKPQAVLNINVAHAVLTINQCEQSVLTIDLCAHVILTIHLCAHVVLSACWRMLCRLSTCALM